MTHVCSSHVSHLRVGISETKYEDPTAEYCNMLIVRIPFSILTC
jgi:hypothetical protein